MFWCSPKYGHIAFSDNEHSDIIDIIELSVTLASCFMRDNLLKLLNYCLRFQRHFLCLCVSLI